MKNIMNIKKLQNLLIISIIIVYEELLFSKLIFNNISNLFYKIIFSLSFSMVLFFITSLFSERLARRIRNLLIGIITFIFGAQFVYYQIYESIISFYSFSNGGQVFQFWQTILEIMKINWYKILLILLPNFVYIIDFIRKKIIHKRIKKGKHFSNETAIYVIKEKFRKKVKFLIIAIAGIIILESIVMLKINNENSDDIYSAKNLYTKTHVPTLMADKFGIITTMRIDLYRLIVDFSDATILAINKNFEEVEEEKIPEYNMLEIDWDTIIENETNETIKLMHEYFSVQQPTQKNDYTGMFEGKNVVVFVAEAFNEVAIDENLTPTLYKLYSQGFQFDNFYTPLFPVSTADGEYITDTSLIPKENVWSLYKVANNYMPYSYANVFESLGYTSQAYHNHSATYYHRDEYLAGMGYDSYLARGTGLEERMDTSHWPNSDLEMVNVTVDDYINDDKFLAYYMTVSGHLEYNIGGNYIANKNWDLVKDLPYSDKAKCYMATQIELDKAVEALITRLEEAGKLDDTVIIISGDHYPYGLTLNELNELSDYEKDDNFEKHRMPLLIWNSQMSEPVKVDKVGCSLDILPTVLNLFGVKFDSRLLMGTDLLSDSEGLVIFSNRSFITEEGRFNSLTKVFEKSEDSIDSNDGENIDVSDDYSSSTNEFNTEEYVNEISKIIYNKYQMSRLILDNNYYKILFENAIYINKNLE